MLKSNWLCLQCDTVNLEKDNECEVCEGKAPIIYSFEALSEEINIGKSTILRWKVGGAENVRIEGVGKVESFGEKIFFLEKNTSFRIVASNDVTERSFEIILKLSLPSITSFEVNSKTINLSSGNILKWTASNYKYLTIVPDEVEVSGKSEMTVFPKKSTIYKIEATNSTGSVEKRIELSLPLPKINFFESSSSEIKEGHDIVLNWDVEYAKKIKITPELGDVSHLEDQMIIITPSKNVKYTLTAENSSGVVECTIELSIIHPEIISFSVSKDVILPDSEVELQWSVKNAKKVEILGYGIVKSTGVEIVNVSENTEFILSAFGDFDVIQQSKCTINVAYIEDFNVYGFLDKKYQLQWKCEYLNKIEIKPLLEAVPSEGIVEIPLSNVSVEYRLIGESKYGDIIERSLILKPCKIVKFELDSTLVYVGRKIKVSWYVENGELVLLNNDIREVEETGTMEIFITKEIENFKISVFGKINFCTQVINLSFIEPPKCDIIRLPHPELNINIDYSELTFPTLGSHQVLGLNMISNLAKIEMPKLPSLSFSKKEIRLGSSYSRVDIFHESVTSTLINLRNTLIKKSIDE